MTVVEGRWSDLRTRVISAAVMVVVGGLAIWAGGTVFLALVLALTGTMMWELARLSAPDAPNQTLALAALAVVALMLTGTIGHPAILLVLLAPSLLLALTPRRDAALVACYAAAIMLAGYGLIGLRLANGIGAIIWLFAVVIASDVLGYFVGRIVGGPKFWPRMSPKKTWSGTVAGWIGAMLVGFVFLWAGGGNWTLVVLSPVLAFAGQMGDIAKSWIKRRAGVKDFSNLIPGHGGVIDRFDAVIGAMVALVVLQWILMISMAQS